MITLALLIVALALYFLGMKQMSEWFPSIEKMIAPRTFDNVSKAKMLIFWPYFVAKDFYDDFRAKHND